MSLEFPYCAGTDGIVAGYWVADLIYHFENCILDTERRELRCAGALRSIEPQVFDLLEYLIRNRERVVSRDELLNVIWRGRVVSDTVLSTRINAARVAIGDNGVEQRAIRTFRRKGFRFAAAIREKKQDLDLSEASIPLWRRLASSVNGAPSILVLPFTSVGGDCGTDHFADGLTEELITALSRFGWFPVVSRSVSPNCERNPVQTMQAAGELGADYLLEGSVRQSAHRVRVSVRLTDGLSAHCLWAERYERDLTEIFDVQDEITEQVASAIGDQLYAEEVIRAKLKPAGTLNTWQCIIHALSMINTRRKSLVSGARRLLQSAVSADPNSAAAYSLLSFVTTLGVHLGWHPRKTALPLAIRTAQKALASNTEEPWGHVALGYATLYNRPDDAIRFLKHGLMLDPNLSMAHYLIALASVYAGDCENAFRHADMAAGLQSRDLLARGNAGAPDNVRATACFMVGRHREGIEFARKTIAQSPRQVPAYRQLVMNCAFAGEMEQAAAALHTVKCLSPDVQRWIEETSTVWGREEDHRKYVEAFRLAGLR